MKCCRFVDVIKMHILCQKMHWDTGDSSYTLGVDDVARISSPTHIMCMFMLSLVNCFYLSAHFDIPDFVGLILCAHLLT